MENHEENRIRKLATLNSYDATAADYAQNTNALHPVEDARKFLRALPHQGKIIDIGCGPGRDAKVFADHDF